MNTCNQEVKKRSAEERPVRYRRPATDVFVDPEKVVLLADVPGVKREDVSLTLENDVLTLEAHASEEPREEFQVLVRESGPRAFRRSFRLNVDVDPEGVRATLKQGVLRIELQRTPESKPARIQIDAA